MSDLATVTTDLLLLLAIFSCVYGALALFALAMERSERATRRQLLRHPPRATRRTRA